MDKTRIADLKRLDRDLKTETRPGVRKIIKESYDKVSEQSKDNWLKSAREALTRESRRNPENMKQIHEDIKKHEASGIKEKSTFHFDLSGIEGFNND